MLFQMEKMKETSIFQEFHIKIWWLESNAKTVKIVFILGEWNLYKEEGLFDNCLILRN